MEVQGLLEELLGRRAQRVKVVENTLQRALLRRLHQVTHLPVHGLVLVEEAASTLLKVLCALPLKKYFLPEESCFVNT